MEWSQRTFGETALETGLLMMGAAHGTNRESAPGSGTASQWPRAETEDQHDKRGVWGGEAGEEAVGRDKWEAIVQDLP